MTRRIALAAMLCLAPMATAARAQEGNAPAAPGGAAAAELGVPVAPPAPRLFTVDRSADPPRVSADQNVVAADHALLELGRALGWRVSFETVELQTHLADEHLDLSFDQQNARTIAHLVAAAGGADVVFDDRTEATGPHTVLHVVAPASAATESGRQRLRRWSVKWYQTFLAEDLALDPLVEEQGMNVRMHLGHLLLRQGDAEGAARVFRSIWERDPTHPFVPVALLRMAEAFHELGNEAEAERWARELTKLHPSLPETAAATVLLGRVLLALGEQDPTRYDECIKLLEASYLRLASRPEIVDVYLLVGEAQRRRGRPDNVLRNMEILAAGHEYHELDERQMLDYLFLRGVGAAGTGRAEDAMQCFEYFLGLCGDDSRRAFVMVQLGECYLQLGRAIEARSAAMEAMRRLDQLDRTARQRARILDATSALAVGDRERAFHDLEVEVRRDPERTPELIMFLADKFLEVGWFQKAVETASLLSEHDGEVGDRARLKKIQALWRQAERTGSIDAFPPQAVALGRRIQDPELQRQVAELLGRAYQALHQTEKAAQAFRGVLQ